MMKVGGIRKIMVLWQAVFLAASPLVTATPSNLTRLYYNGSSAKCHSITTQYGQPRRLKISPQFFLNPKPTVPRGSTKRASIRGKNGLLSLKKLYIFPASSVHVSLFFLSLIQESVSCSTIDEVRYGLKWVHDLAGLPDPCNSSLVLSLIESAKRLLSIPVKKKEPVNPEAIQLLFAKYSSSSASLSDLRVLTLCVFRLYRVFSL